MTSTVTRRRRRNIDNAAFIAAIARFIHAAGQRTAQSDPEDLTALIGLRDQVDEAIIAAVRGLRTANVTWEDIGAATGTTRQAAIMKWSKLV